MYRLPKISGSLYIVPRKFVRCFRKGPKNEKQKICLANFGHVERSIKRIFLEQSYSLAAVLVETKSVMWRNFPHNRLSCGENLHMTGCHVENYLHMVNV